jgi:predicted KAP-like P-loop ATPase
VSPSAVAGVPPWLRHLRIILTAQKAALILVAGFGFLLAENAGRLASLFPKSTPDLKPYCGSAVALLIVLLGVVGLSWRRFSAFFSRWGRNREPIVWDALLAGAAAGILLHVLWQRVWDGVWQPWWAILLLAIFSVCIWRAQKLSANQPQPSRASPDRLLNDDPLPDLTPETDAFGRLKFAATLTEAICQNDPSACHVLGLVGQWGSGKTTIIKAVSDKCQATGHRVVTIDAWAFRETGRLTEALLTNIVKDIDQRYLLPNLKRTLARYLSIISPVVSKIPVLEALSKAVAGADELDNLKNALTAAVQSTQDRFLVVVDDVDRLDAAEFQSLVKSVRLCASIPRIAYILAYDRASIFRLVSKEDSALARDFMDKVVEDEWAMPLIPHEKLSDYVRQHCASSLAGRPKRFADDFEERLKESLPALRQLLRTPRQIKRAGISLSRRSTLLSKLNPFDAFIWTVLRQREPALYEFITQHPWLLRPDRGLEVDWVLRLLGDKERRKKEIEEIEKLIDKTSDNAQSTKDLFWTLFPREEQTSESAEAKEIRLRRISNSRFFDAYFLLESGEDASRPERIDAFTAELNTATSPQAVHDLVSKAMETALSAGVCRRRVSDKCLSRMSVSRARC